MANSTGNATEGILANGLDVKGNLTLLESVSQLPTMLWQHRDLLLLEVRIVSTALACIYLGSQAALRRPPSASPPPKKKSKTGGKEDNNDDDKDDDYVQGLVPTDAIMFPILAGTVLVGLYYLIKWLEDPAILNKIMGVYFSLMSLASMGKFLGDGLHFLTGLVFPESWRASNGNIYRFDGVKKRQYHLTDSGERAYDEAKKTPLPGGRLSELILSERTSNSLWEVRHLYQENWTVRLAMHGIAKQSFKVKLNDVLGVVLAIGAGIIYQSTKSIFLSNVMGYSFSYAGIITLSPTTFTTGSAVLFGLFFYDIYMVFYTPYMVTVATKLDVPIKLVFEGPTRSSMLGLGDIVVPGMFIGLCLRFDHFMYYYRQRKLVPVKLETEENTPDEVVTTSETQRMVVKPKYVNPMGQWGNRFWSTSIGKMLSPDATPAVQASAFPKTYFYASMFGYLVGMMATLAMLLVFKQAQPALLYLVPGVVSSVWITGLARGELHEMWIYTEDGSLDKEDVIVEVDGDGNFVKEIKDEKEKDDIKVDDKAADVTNTIKESGEPRPLEKVPSETNNKKSSSRKVFAFTIEAPPSLTEEVEE
ncbi:intramembrane protease [Xylariales sp. AK1849]|nr:intramembrane protease [Xylariales sp. AK1849]